MGEWEKRKVGQSILPFWGMHTKVLLRDLWQASQIIITAHRPVQFVLVYPLLITPTFSLLYYYPYTPSAYNY